jgi:hypothetical protein
MTPKTVSLDELMKNILFGEFAAHFGFMAAYQATLEERFKNEEPEFVGIVNDYYSLLLERLTALLAIMQQLELQVSAGYLQDALDVLAKAKVRETQRLLDSNGSKMLRQHLQYVGNLVVRELQTKHFLALTPMEARLAHPDFKTWAKAGDFRDKFPSALYDVDEAAKCLAFGRGTACVFHLMRVVELGARAVYHHLRIAIPLTGYDRNIGTVLNRIHEAIEAKGKQWPEREKLMEVWLLFDAVKNAWRNVTMHVESKFTPEEANIIGDTVQGIMVRVTSRMNESGDPKI